MSLREVLDQGVNSLLGHSAAGPDTRDPTMGEPKKLQASLEDSAHSHTPPQSQGDADAISATRRSHELLAHEAPGTDPVAADHLVHEKLDTFDPDGVEDGASLEAPLHSITARLSSDDAGGAALQSPLDHDAEPIVENATGGAVQSGEEADDSEERFSLRTRSMAEVLAEQGDIKGALDIYHELAAAATAPEESADLRKRIATLNARLGSAPPVEQTQEPAEAGGSTGKDKLISMLEALAERVEARAHS